MSVSITNYKLKIKRGIDTYTNIRKSGLQVNPHAF